ncbi:DNA replication licensing factor Mcm3 [Ischnura elegans]|uniref:DNA replication licensing factor Mcm3 n=1 Tax=Ischnura elegans TaxID=197161 RepID=UPI001ED8980F|nr:DNA replication licensing factor Mcm3 [Ischnura elegans]
MDLQEIDQRLRDYQREYLSFLDDEDDQGMYAQVVKNMIEDKGQRLIVNINHLRKKLPARAAALLKNGFEELGALQRALHEYVSSIDVSYAKKYEELFVGLEGSFGSRHVTPRSLTSRFIGNMVCVEGIVTKCSLVRLKVVRSVHYCPATKKVLERKYTDLTSFDAFPSGSVYPTADEDGNLLETEYGLCNYKDHQTLTIQEMPEKAPAGQLPRAVDIICDNDLVDQCKPGDRVQIVGNYRCLPNKQGSLTTGVFRTVMIACNIMQMSKETSVPSIKREDIRVCKKLARYKGSSRDPNGAKNIFELLSQSLAPSIHGHTYVKRAILCMLLGGVEKVLVNGTRLRGDINILLIGDPSVAKSQLLRYVLCTAPRAVPTTGRGSSGVGLTAAVTTDQETGEKRLEAGAMVLADRGVVCIDEFDKMSDMDRTAIHEVMEQGRVTIAKAGIHARLNARCSVLAAANPVYGRYDQYKTPMENIGLQDSLLSRFDLLFVMLDIVDPEIDSKISDHVVRMHRYRNPKEQDGEVLPMGSTWSDQLSTMNPDKENGELENGNDSEETSTQVYEKYDPLLHGATRSKSDKIISVDFMRKYIHIARCIKPTLTSEAAAAIAEEYSKLRSQDAITESDVARTQPVTVRTLETLIRLSTAHARSRLSRSIEMEDALAAIELVQYAYFKKVLEKEKKKRKRNDAEDSQESQSEGLTGDTAGESDGAEGLTNGRPRRKKTKRARKSGDKASGDPFDFDSADEMVDLEQAVRAGEQLSPSPAKGASTRSRRGAAETETQSTSGTSTAEQEPISDEQLNAFKTKLFHLFKNERCQSLPIGQVHTMAGDELSLTANQVSTAIARMTEQNQVMLADNVLFLI